MQTYCGEMYITLTFTDNYKPHEILIRLGKAGGCSSAIMSGISELATAALKTGLEPIEIIKAFRGIKCHGSHRNTCLNAIAEVLQQYDMKTKPIIKELKQIKKVG